MNNEIVLDIESNGFIFESTCIWTISARNTFTDERLTINPFKDGQAKNKLMDFVFQEDNPTIIFHNGLGFDIFVIMNILGIEFSVGKDSWDGKPCQWIDTFYLSMFLNPDRQGHSVEYFGDILGLEKIDWRKECIDLGMIEKDSPDGQEFKQYHPKMDVYCLTPDHKVLNSQLHWVELGSLKLGDKIMAFDEDGPARKYRTATVLSNQRKIAPVYAVTLSSGEVIKTTAEHKWLVCQSKGKNSVGFGAYKWVETKNLRYTGKYCSKVPKVVNVWEEDQSKESGWLAGMFDGEGSVRNSSFGISISQRPTMILDRLEKTLAEKGVGFGKRITGSKSDCISLNLHGTACEKMEFLGKHRPERLISKFSFEKLGRFENRGAVSSVVSVEFLGDMEIVELQTDIRTFVADGYPMHNCERDVDVNILIFNYLKKEWKEVYGKEFSITDAFRCGQKSFFLMSCQELTGWKFDIDLANRLVVQISDMMEEIRKEVEPQLPPRELKKGEQKEYTMPAKPFKKDGTFSATWMKWVEKHNGVQRGEQWEFYGKLYDVIGGQLLDIKLPMEMANQDQMKDWFLQGSVKKEFLHLYEDIEWVED